jgi:alkanesulfonate monooxygenase SsuD/methylene tetrahydromethanopterin reductase-like flavin-dependent oxidoreductase (luciferase family)
MSATTTAASRYGVHTPLQHVGVSELASVWRAADDLGFGWISVWDHLDALTGDTTNLDAVAMHAALALTTRHARVGCLVYSASYRSAGVLATTAATLDHLSGGRAVMGLGAGYHAVEHERYDIELRPPGARVRHLEEVLVAVRALLDGERVDMTGETVTLRGALARPVPVQARLPLWIGGGGERRTIPLAARLADGWNVPMASLDDFARKCEVLRHAAADARRDPSTIEASVNLGLCWDETRIPERFGERWPALRPAILAGSTQQVIDTVAAYRAAGADTVILSLRAPFDTDEIERFATEVAPVVP